MQRILDLGCGKGDSWRGFGLKADDSKIVGIDISFGRLQEANSKYSREGWGYACARGENLPLADGSFDGVVCNVALPYMHIPKAIAELRRVLVPGGWVRMALHAPGFTWAELKHCFPKPKASLFRIYVFLNGLLLHLTGRQISLGRICESCQTEKGMQRVLKRSGFTDISFSHSGARFFFQARKEGPAATNPALAQPAGSQVSGRVCQARVSSFS